MKTEWRILRYIHILGCYCTPKGVQKFSHAFTHYAKRRLMTLHLYSNTAYIYVIFCILATIIVGHQLYI